MKDHNDVIKRVFQRRDEYYTKQKQQKRIVLNTIGFFCIVALITTGAWHIGFFDKAHQDETGNKPHQTIIPGFKTPAQSDDGSYGGADPNPSIVIRSLKELDRMRKVVEVEDEETLKTYLRSLAGGGAETRDDLTSFISLIESLPIVKFIEGEITYISHQEGYSHDKDEYYNIAFVSIKSNNGDWTRIEYLLSVDDIPAEIERRKAEDGFAKSILDNPIYSKDKRIKVYSETREQHISGNGDSITWIMDIDGIFVRVVYYTNNISAINTKKVLDDSIIYNIS